VDECKSLPATSAANVKHSAAFTNSAVVRISTSVSSGVSSLENSPSMIIPPWNRVQVEIWDAKLWAVYQMLVSSAETGRFSRSQHGFQPVSIGRFRYIASRAER